MCLPLRRASVFLRQRAREWTVTGLRMIRPSFTSLRICWPEDRGKQISYRDVWINLPENMFPQENLEKYLRNQTWLQQQVVQEFYAVYLMQLIASGKKRQPYISYFRRKYYLYFLINIRMERYVTIYPHSFFCTLSNWLHLLSNLKYKGFKTDSYQLTGALKDIEILTRLAIKHLLDSLKQT